MSAPTEPAPTKVDIKPTKADGPQIKVTTTPVPVAETTDVAGSTETEWKITIKGSDGATSEVMLSPVTAKTPTRQEVNIYMPEAKAMDGADPEKAKVDEPAPEPKKYLWYTMTQQALTAIFSIIIIAVEALTLVKYHSTQNVAGAWPTNPLLTPTYVLLAMAVLSCTADIITFSVNCCYGRVKNTAMSIVEKIRSVMGFLQAVATAIGAGYFKAAQTWSGTADLWGWSCSNAADAMQSVNSSGTLCSSNATAWWLAILQTALHALTVVMALWALANPQGSFKDHSSEAGKVLSDGQAQDSKIQSEFGPPAKK